METILFNRFLHVIIISVLIFGFVSTQTTGFNEEDYEEYTDSTESTNSSSSVTKDLSAFLDELFADDYSFSTETFDDVNNDTQENNVSVPATQNSSEINTTDMTSAVSLRSSTFQWPNTETLLKNESSSTYFYDDDVEEEERTESDNCYQEATLQNFCTVSDDMMDLSFWDLYAVLFDDSILEALIIECTRGTWCLQDRFDYWDASIVERAEMTMKSEIAADMCTAEMTSCLDVITSSYSNCSVYSQLMFSYEAIKLACHLRENPDLSLDCFKQTLVSLHITVADVLREQEEGEEADEDEGQCNAAETSMTKGLICMENACPGESEAFRGFEPWQWFTDDVYELINECELDPNTCINVLQVGNSSSSKSLTSPLTSSSSSKSRNAVQTTPWFWENPETVISTSTVQSTPDEVYNSKPFGEQMLKKEVGVMVGMSIGATIIAIVMLLLSVTCYKRYRRNAVLKDGYQKLLNDGDES